MKTYARIASIKAHLDMLNELVAMDQAISGLTATGDRDHVDHTTAWSLAKSVATLTDQIQAEVIEMSRGIFE